jgi:hypothetical protein
MIKQGAFMPNIYRLGQLVITALLRLAVLFLVGSSIQGQDGPVKQKVVEQMRQIANSMKQCSPRRVNTAQQRFCKVTYFYSGPPANLEWDVVPSKTARSPFQGVIEFTLPERSESVEQPNLSDKDRQKCEQDERQDKRDRIAMEAEVSAMGMKDDVAREVQRLEKEGQKYQALAEKKKLHDTYYRYEFDLGSGPPELVKMLLVGKDSDNNIVSKPVSLEAGYIPHPLSWAGTDPAISDPTACWVVSAKSGVK